MIRIWCSSKYMDTCEEEHRLGGAARRPIVLPSVGILALKAPEIQKNILLPSQCGFEIETISFQLCQEPLLIQPLICFFTQDGCYSINVTERSSHNSPSSRNSRDHAIITIWSAYPCPQNSDLLVIILKSTLASRPLGVPLSSIVHNILFHSSFSKLFQTKWIQLHVVTSIVLKVAILSD